MPDSVSRSSARLLAPVALAVFAFAFFAVLLSSGSGGDEEEGNRDETAAERPAPRRERRQAPESRATGSTYTVKTGDTLAGIADKTGVPVDRLQELNPELDPQALVSGQKIKLRE